MKPFARSAVCCLLVAAASHDRADPPKMGAEDSSRSAGNNPPARGNAPVAELHDRSAVDVIHEYVRRTRGWARSDYRIEPKGTTADIERYWIVYVDDEKDPVAALAGARKSFAVDYDPLRHEVTKEWRFQ